MGFADSVRKSGDKMLKEVNSAGIKIAKELFTLTVLGTPVGTSATKGQLINNWNVGIGVGIYPDTTTQSFNTSGMRSYNQISKLNNSKEFLGKDGEVSFTNNVDYAYRAEYAGWPAPKWTGTVVPYAMVRKALLQTASKYR